MEQDLLALTGTHNLYNSLASGLQGIPTRVYVRSFRVIDIINTTHAKHLFQTVLDTRIGIDWYA